MNITHRLLRAIAVVGVSAAAPLAAAMPAHAGVIAKPPPDAVVTPGVDPGSGGELADFPPGPNATDFPPGPGATDYPPGPGATDWPPGPGATDTPPGPSIIAI
jgi:hypothetical protein